MIIKLSIFSITITFFILICIFLFLYLYIRLLKQKIKKNCDVINQSKFLLIKEKEFSDSIIDNANILIFIWRIDGTLMKINKYSEKVAGYLEEEVINKHYMELFNFDETKKYMSYVFNNFNLKSPPTPHENILICKDNHHINVLWTDNIITDENNLPSYIVSMGVDLTERKKYEIKLLENLNELKLLHEELSIAEEELREQYDDLQKSETALNTMAYYDPLTNLPNKTYFKKIIANTIQSNSIQKTKFALILLDIDNFKSINDSLGHNFGDELLINITSKLKDINNNNYLLSRIGGDSFAFILKNVNENKDILHFISQMLTPFKHSIKINDYRIYVTFSIGISLYPNNGADKDILYKNAEAAMYHVKGNGKNNFHFYTNEMNTEIMEKLNLENDLRNAILNKEFVLYYQPKIDTRTGKVIGMEALVRWLHPTKGIVSPLKFIPLAEETGLISKIGEFVLFSACKQTKLWHDLGYYPLRVAVNVSPYQLQRRNLLSKVKSALNYSGLSPEYLELEITESCAMYNFKLTISILNDLRKLGIKISLDDFGTGYSSLGYLKQLPIDTLKLDKSFINNINSSSNEKAIVSNLISLAHDINLSVVAEGVENKHQIEFLKFKNCDELQGYYFSKPIPSNEFENLLKQDKSTFCI